MIHDCLQDLLEQIHQSSTAKEVVTETRFQQQNQPQILGRDITQVQLQQAVVESVPQMREPTAIQLILPTNLGASVPNPRVTQNSVQVASSIGKILKLSFFSC